MTRRARRGGVLPVVRPVVACDPAPLPPDLWGPFRPQWIPYPATGVWALMLGFAQVAAHIADVPNWRANSLGHWHRI